MVQCPVAGRQQLAACAALSTWQVGQLWLLPVQPHCLLPAADLSLLLCHAHACRQPSHELILCTTWDMPA